MIMPCTRYGNNNKEMKTKRNYVAPVTTEYALVVSNLMGGSAPTASFISSPSVGDAGEGDEIGTESRSGDGFWDE